MDRARRRSAALCLLSLFSLAAADCSGTRTINPTNVPKSIASCANWSGTLVVGPFIAPTGFDTGNNALQTTAVALPSLSSVTGDLIFTGIQSGSVSTRTSSPPSPSPRTTSTQTRKRAEPSSAFNGDAVTLSIDISALSWVSGNLVFKDLDAVKIEPELSTLSYAHGIQFSNVNFGDWTLNDKYLKVLQHAYNISVTQTNAASIGPFAFNLEVEETNPGDARIEVTENKDLSSVEFNGFTSFQRTDVDIRDNNNPTLNFPDMTNAFLSISGVKGLNAPAVVTLYAGTTGDPQYITRNSFKELDLSGVTEITGRMNIVENEQLSTIDLQSLSSAENLEILNNGKLSKVTIPKLTPNPVTLKDSKQVCSSIQWPDATYKCVTVATSSVSGSTSASSGASTGSGSGGLSTGAKAGIGVGVGVGALLIAGVLLFYCCRRRRDKSYSAREISSEPYSKSQHSYTESGEMAYSKVPYHSGAGAGMSEPHTEEHTPTDPLADNWTPPERQIPTAHDRVELEEQQGMRHEMDARSLPDMDSDEDEEADTRSLEDIERIHRER